MTGIRHKTSDVFGIQRDVPANYVTRSHVDDVFIDSLARDKHIVVYGSSKQGKTSLRRYNLLPEDYISITCGNTTTLAGLHSAILKEAGYTVEQSATRTVSGAAKINARVSGEMNLGFVKVGGELGGEEGEEVVKSVTEVELELDPSDVNDIIRALENIGFDRYIVLEDFHYLPLETQEAFAIALKAFHEGSRFTFVVVGVWLDENRLVQFNGDLTGRVLAVDADAWSSDDLVEVISKGESLLNVKIDQDCSAELVNGSFQSVYIVQDACYRLCTSEGIHETQDEQRTIGTGVDARELVRSIVDEQSARYDNFLDTFAGGFQETSLEMYRWLLLPILSASPEVLEEGLSYNVLRRVIDANHPRSPLNLGNLTQALRSVASLQVTKKITPIILDYDLTRRRLNVVDRGFLIWLNYQNREELLGNAGLPETPVIPTDVTLGGTGQQRLK